MLNRMKYGVLLLMTVCMLFACAAGTAESMHREIGNSAFDMEVTVGYNGLMTYGKVMPVRVRIRNFGEDFEGVLGMNAYINAKEYDRYERNIVLPAGSEREFELPVTVFMQQKTFTAEIVKDGEVVCSAGGEPAALINPASMLVGILSTRPQNLNNLTIDRDNDALNRYEFWKAIPLTADSLPEDESAMKSFGILVLDDLDPATLSEKQRAALDGWLRSGRILICGGGASAARNIPFFSGYTGLSMEGVNTSNSVIGSLEKLLGRSESGKNVTTTLAEYSGAEPISTDEEGHGLIWSTSAGAGRIYTTAFEAGDPKLNSEHLMHYFWQQLLVNLDQDLYSSVMYYNAGNDSNVSTNGSSYITIPVRNRIIPGMMIVAGTLVLACVLWWILKKKDLRQWMWLVLPLLSVLSVISMLLLASGADTNQPMAVIAEDVIQDRTGAARSYFGFTVAAPSYGRHSYTVAGEKLKVQVYDYVDYDEEDGKKQPEPNQMRTCYTIGGTNSITAESAEPWQMINLTAESAARMQGRIDGAIWMEEDGLHGEIVNGTDLKMTAGHVITTYGFVSVPALAPGEKTDIVLKRSTFANPQKPEYKDGCMYPESPNMYSVINTAMGYDEEVSGSGRPDVQERAMAASLINSASDMLRRGQGNWSYGAYDSAMFLYCAKPENLTPAELSVDGAPVERKGTAAMLTAELSYTSIGRTGVIYRSAGMDTPVRVETEEDLMPTEKIVPNGKAMYYHTLSENPTFLYTLDGLDGVKIVNLQVILNSYYVNQARAYALNIEKHEWEEVPTNQNIDRPERYLDSSGKLFLQFRTDGQDMYADISTPLINLEGRLEKHAED